MITIKHWKRAPKQAAATDMSEAEAIRFAQKGDPNAFTRLHMTHSQRVYGLFLRMAGNQTDAEDLTGQAFLPIFRAMHTHRGEFSLSTRLYCRTLNILLKQLRKKYAGHSTGVKLPAAMTPHW